MQTARRRAHEARRPEQDLQEDSAPGRGSRSSFHTLRHTHVSMLLAAGVPIKTVQERLGHASIQTTMDTYGHLMENAQAEAAHRLDDMIGMHNISELL